MQLPTRTQLCALGAALSAFTSGCADAGDDPFASVVGDETRGALELRTLLPSPDAWAEELSIERLAGLSEWESSWTFGTTEARGSRESAYRVMVPALSGHLGDVDLAGGLASLEAALDEAERVPSEEIPERIAIRLDLARDAQLRGGLALENGDTARALTELLRGTDALREVEPRHVAIQLLTAAEEGMRRLLSADSYSEETREQAQSLIRIARTAMRDTDFTRAIQSAYYATQLLDVDVR